MFKLEVKLKILETTTFYIRNPMFQLLIELAKFQIRNIAAS